MQQRSPSSPTTHKQQFKNQNGQLSKFDEISGETSSENYNMAIKRNLNAE